MDEKTKIEVVFLYNEKQKDLFAYFPKEDFGYSGSKTSYSQIGQHSACNPKYAKESREATKKEYKDLKKELEFIGYELLIKNLN